MERTFVAIDVETTGLEPGVDEIIEVAAVKFCGDEVLETFARLVRPRHSLPLKITRLTGITQAMVADAPPFSAVAPDLVRFVRSYPLVGHSVGFDLRMLQAQGMRFAQPAYDTFDMATLLMPQAPAYRLGALAAALGIPHDAAHRALSDADVTRQVFLRLLRAIETIDLVELSEISRLTARIDWPLRELFTSVEREKARRVFVENGGQGPGVGGQGSGVGDQGSGGRGRGERSRGQGEGAIFGLGGDDSTARSSSARQSPLKPTGDTSLLDLADVRRFFAPDGALGQAFPGYEERPQQLAMAEAVARAFNHGDALMVEAGTGTGKGMAYLVPAALYAARRGERVVISTNTINLQDQLFFKDIPELQRIMARGQGSGVRGQGSGVGDQGSGVGDQGSGAGDQGSGVGGQGSGAGGQETLHTSCFNLHPSGALHPSSFIPHPFTAALLKGRGNYLCLRRYKALRRDERLLADEVRTLLKVQLWLPGTTSGDKAELLLMDKENIAWDRISAALDTCTGPRCPDYNDCFFFKARREAEAAHLVVVNHALMLADLAADSSVLPPYDHLIIDEAHNLEDVATDQFGFEVDQAALLAFLDDLYETGGANIVGGLLSELPAHFRESAATQGDMDKATAIADTMRPAVDRARPAVYDCFNLLTVFVAREAEVTSYDARLRLTPAVRSNQAWAAVERAWENLGLHLNTIGDGLGKLEVLLGELKDAELLDYDTLLLRVQALRRYAVEVRVNIGHTITGGNEELITWLTHDRQRDTLTLSAAPLSVAELLQANLFSQKATTVLASATLAVAGEFGYVKERIGLPEPEELLLDSPFDYERQALVYIPNDIPEPNQRGYQQMLEQALIDLCTATGGRALALFTANSALRQTYRAIQEPLEEQGIAVLGQGIDGSRRALLARFKEFPRTVLLGTTSFWEGVDVVGDALSVLVIAKLPFSVPTDPVFAARSERFADAFGQYAVPQAILRFKQGFGRLIRSREDRGIVAVLDKRLLTKKYGQLFLDSLPQTQVRSGPLRHLPPLAGRFLA